MHSLPAGPAAVAPPTLGISRGLTRDTGGEATEASACSTDRLADFVATVSAKDQQLGDWLQRALAAFLDDQPVPKLDRRRKAELGEAG